MNVQSRAGQTRVGGWVTILVVEVAVGKERCCSVERRRKNERLVSEDTRESTQCTQVQRSKH